MNGGATERQEHCSAEGRALADASVGLGRHHRFGGGGRLVRKVGRSLVYLLFQLTIEDRIVNGNSYLS